MLKDRKELEENLSAAIEQIKHKRKNIEEVNKTLSEFDVTHGFFTELTNKYELLREIDLSLLCLVSIAVFKLVGTENIRPESYFTSGEIEEAKKYKEEHRQDVKLPITVENVLQIDYENYVTVIKITEIVKWYHSKLIFYDHEMQRSPKYKRGKDGVVPVPDVNMDSVRDISEHMLDESYIPDMITLNAFSDESETVAYNPKTRQLTIMDGATISILDGFHRLQGAVRAATINTDIQQDIILSIRTFDTDTAKKYFGQINTINIVKQERLAELKQEKVSYVAVKHLQMNSDLKGKIASGSKVSEIAGHLTTADLVANAIEDTFEPKNSFESREAGNYLAEFFNYLLGLFSDQFNNKDSLMRHPRMFIGYIVIAKQMQDHNIPMNKLKEIIPALNLTEDNKELFEVVTYNRGTSSRLQKKVKEYFDKLDIKNMLNIGV